MITICLAAAGIGLAIAEDAALEAGGMLTVQIELPEEVTAEVRLIDVVRGSIVARKQITQLTPDQVTFRLPDWLGSAALELWVDGRQALRLPADAATGFDLETAASICTSDALPCDSSGASLAGADLSGATLSGVDLSRTDLRDARLSDANLSAADLTASVLAGADLGGANLGDATLLGADLGRARLYAANLEGADLRSADLSDADLTNANLANADLLGANVARARLSGVELSGARCPDGYRARQSCDGHWQYP